MAISFPAYLHRPGDLGGYVAVGQAVLSRVDPYVGTGVQEYGQQNNTWPPFYSVACVPLALLRHVNLCLVRIVWIALGWAAVLWVMGLLVKLGSGHGLDQRREITLDSLVSPEVVVPMILTLSYTISNFEHHQVNVILFALTLAGLYLQATGRDAWGGVSLGAAAALKVMPVVFIPYLAYRRRWRAAFYTAAATAAFSLSPILIFGWGNFWRYANEWIAVLPQRGWSTGNTNQSVYAMWDRILGHGMAPFLAPGQVYLLATHEPRVKVAWALTLVVAIFFGFLTFRGRLSPGSRWEQAEWAVVFIASVIFGPVTLKQYLVVLILPNAVLYAAWRSPDLAPSVRRMAAAVLLLCFLLSLSINHTPFNALATRLETGSSVTLAALIMLGGLFWYRSRANA